MDAITQHRKKRLEQIIAAEPYNGDRAKFMKAAALTKGRISQLLDPEEVFGELAAERLAEKLRLPDPRWFDQGSLGPSIAWPFVLLTLEMAATLEPVNMQTVEKLALHLLSTQKTTKVSVVRRSKLDAPTRRAPTTHAQYTSQRTELNGQVIQLDGKPARKTGRR